MHSQNSFFNKWDSMYAGKSAWLLHQEEVTEAQFWTKVGLKIPLHLHTLNFTHTTQ